MPRPRTPRVGPQACLRPGARPATYSSIPVKSGAPGGDTPLVEDASGFDHVLAAARSGEHWACREIWTRYSSAVGSFLAVRGAREPEDLTSEVFLAVFSALAKFEGDEGGLRALIFTIAHRRLADEFRRRARRPDCYAWDESTDRRSTASAEQLALDDVGTAWARDLIEALSADQRDVLMLRIFGDLTVEQVAQLLGKPTGAVKALQRRGLNALRKKLGAAGYPYAVVERLVETT